MRTALLALLFCGLFACSRAPREAKEESRDNLSGQSGNFKETVPANPAQQGSEDIVVGAKPSVRPGASPVENGDLFAVLNLFSVISGRPVYIDLSMPRALRVSNKVAGDVSRAREGEVIRSVLLQEDGIRLRDLPSGETLVELAASPREERPTVKPDSSATTGAKLALQFPKSEIQDVLAYYQRLAGQRVFAALDLAGRVSINLEVPASDAPEALRKALLDQNSVELRALNSGEVLAGWANRGEASAIPVPAAGLHRVPLTAALQRYAAAAKRAVYVDNAIRPDAIVLKTGVPAFAPGTEAESIRAALRQQDGVLLRDLPSGETLVDLATPPQEERPKRRSPPADPESKESLQFPNTDILDVLEFYCRRSDQRLYRALELEGVVWVNLETTAAEALGALRKALLDDNGIELRELDTGEVLARRLHAAKPQPSRRPGPPRSPQFERMPVKEQRSWTLDAATTLRIVDMDGERRLVDSANRVLLGMEPSEVVRAATRNAAESAVILQMARREDPAPGSQNVFVHFYHTRLVVVRKTVDGLVAEPVLEAGDSFIDERGKVIREITELSDDARRIKASIGQMENGAMNFRARSIQLNPAKFLDPENNFKPTLPEGETQWELANGAVLTIRRQENGAREIVDERNRVLLSLGDTEVVTQSLKNKSGDVLVLLSKFVRVFEGDGYSGKGYWYARLLRFHSERGEVKMRDRFRSNASFMKEPDRSIMTLKSLSDDGDILTANVGEQAALVSSVKYADRQLSLSREKFLD